MVFAWKAGQDPERYAPLALANMTGANRLLIGVGWSVVALVAIAAMRRKAAADQDAAMSATPAVELRQVQVVELGFLALASFYALSLPLRATLNWIDTVILFGIFVAYVWRVRAVDNTPSDTQADDEDEDEEASELFGPAARIAVLSTGARRMFTAGMLLVAAAVILAVAEPFAESLVETGRELQVSEFLLVQWVAPLASETPEFIAVLLLAWKLQSASALGALISSKINQWTLLVGILPLVFALSAGSLSGLPVDAVQREELLLTAAQSVFAVGLVVTGRLTRRGAWALLLLFGAQFLAAWILPANLRGIERIAIAVVYLVLAAALLVRRRRALGHVLAAAIGRGAVRKVPTSSERG